MKPTLTLCQRVLLMLSLSWAAWSAHASNPPGLSPPVASVPADPQAVQLVRISVRSPAERQRLQHLGLDLTEHAGPDFIEALLYRAQDAQSLLDARFKFSVRIPDMAKRDIENRRADAAYAKANATSPLPSGRTAYRVLADYEADLRKLANDHPQLARLLVLNHKTVEGREVLGIEISTGVTASDDGKPVFVVLGVHHAREWPAGETSMEFAFDLIKSYVAGDARVRALLQSTRVVVVPVVNPDGFHVSRGALLEFAGTPLSTNDPALGGRIDSYAPGGAYQRKNCRVVDGQVTPPGACVSPSGLAHVGVDNNRNYGLNWGAVLSGGAVLGASGDSNPLGQSYSGPAPFSEPETQNVRELISTRQVTTLITTHTFAGLVLRVPGETGLGVTDDDEAIIELGHRMATENGSVSKPWWQLYDARGITEDWSYGVTGGYGYTYELGVTEFHPEFTQTIENYLGRGAYAGKGTRGAYLLAAEAAADARHHGVLKGQAAPGTVLRLSKRFDSKTKDGTPVPEHLESKLTVPADGQFSWHVNPSTRPESLPHYTESLGAEISPPTLVVKQISLPETVDTELVIERPNLPAMKITLTWPPNPTDTFGSVLLLEVYLRDENGGLALASTGTYVVGDDGRYRTEATLLRPQAGRYVLRAYNENTAVEEFTLTLAEHKLKRTLVSGTDVQETYELSCEQPEGAVLQTVAVAVKRGEERVLELGPCAAAAKSEGSGLFVGSPAPALLLLGLAGALLMRIRGRGRWQCCGAA